MENHADQKRVAGLLPVVPAFECPFGVHQNVGDVLHIADFPFALPHFEQRIVAGTLRVGWIEQQAMRELRPETGRQLPVLTLDVVDDGGMWPGQQCRDDKTNALAGTGRRKGQHMFRAVMTEIGIAQLSQKHALPGKELGALQVLELGPACRAVGRDVL